MAKSNFIILSGGPGLKLGCDKQHDQAWSNYVDAVLIDAKRGKLFDPRLEEVWFFVYEKAYDLRWADDVKNKNPSAESTKRKGFTSYADQIEKNAKKYGLNYRAVADGNDVWKKLKTFRDAISRFWFVGHARKDLWLRLEHNSKCTPVGPPAGEIVRASSIPIHAKALKEKFPSRTSYSATFSSRFYGCNTASFAKSWAVSMRTYAEGAVGTLSFEKTHSVNEMWDSYEKSCTWVRYSPYGKEI